MSFSQDYLFILSGALLLIVALLGLRDRSNPKRVTTSLFWFLYSLLFFFGDWLYHLDPVSADLAESQRNIEIVAGVIVLALCVIAGFGGLGMGKAREKTAAVRAAYARRFGNKLFVPALVIPCGTLLGVLLFKLVPGLPELVLGEEAKNAAMHTLVPFTISVIIAVILAMRLTRAKLMDPVQEARRLLDPIGWAFILPQLLATMGLLFTEAGVGKDIAYIFKEYISLNYFLLAVVVFVVCMALLTVVMGNAFAAFPIMVAGIGYPVLVQQYGGDPQVMAAVGMFSGYCGTLLTPMAANFNLVPVALLNLPTRGAVIRQQWPTAIGVMVANILILYFCL